MNPAWFARRVIDLLADILAALQALGVRTAQEVAEHPPQELEPDCLEALQRLHMGSPMTTAQVRIALGVSRTSLDRLISEGTRNGLPPPTFRLSPQRDRWRGSEVIAWVEQVNALKLRGSD